MVHVISMIYMMYIIYVINMIFTRCARDSREDATLLYALPRVPYHNINSYFAQLRQQPRPCLVYFTRVPYYVLSINCFCWVPSADPRFAATEPRFRLMRDLGAWCALPAATYILGVNLEGLGPGGVISVWDQGAINKCKFVCVRVLTNETSRKYQQLTNQRVSRTSGKPYCTSPEHAPRVAFSSVTCLRCVYTGRTAIVFFPHPIYYPRTTLALPPSSNSDPGSHSGPSSPIPTTLRAFIFIARRIQHFFPRRLASNRHTSLTPNTSFFG